MHHQSHANFSIDCIKSVPIFGSLTPEEMTEVAIITSGRSFERNEMITMSRSVLSSNLS